jgi:hypothetical protein
MTTKDLAAINDSLKAYRELLPLMHEPSNVKQVTDAIRKLENIKVCGWPASNGHNCDSDDWEY